jgi:hypothetical protein
MSKERKRNLWDKINDIDYIDIIDIHEEVNSDQITEYKNSKVQLVFIMIGTIFMLCVGVYSFVKEPDIFLNKIYLSIIIGASLLAGLLFSIFSYKRNKTILSLSIKAITYKDKFITWDRIKKMYVKKQDDGNGYCYTLVLEMKIGYKEYITLDGLNENYNWIINEIGKYYWNWKNQNNAT